MWRAAGFAGGCAAWVASEGACLAGAGADGAAGAGATGTVGCADWVTVSVVPPPNGCAKYPAAPLMPPQMLLPTPDQVHLLVLGRPSSVRGCPPPELWG